MNKTRKYTYTSWQAAVCTRAEHVTRRCKASLRARNKKKLLRTSSSSIPEFDGETLKQSAIGETTAIRDLFCKRWNEVDTSAYVRVKISAGGFIREVAISF